MTGTVATATREAVSELNASAPRAKTRSRRFRREGRAGYLFLAPSLLFFLIFLILPSFFAIFLSLSKWGGYDLTQIHFIGVQNYTDILNFNGTFVSQILVNTLVFEELSVVVAVVGGVMVGE